MLVELLRQQSSNLVVYLVLLAESPEIAKWPRLLGSYGIDYRDFLKECSRVLIDAT